MNLKFLGRGSMMNIGEGNNSAYFISDDELFLIDCGYTVIQRMMENNLLDNIKKVNILITHMHFDHIGSIGALIEYSYNFYNIKPNIIVSENVLYKDNLIKLLDITGVSNKRYNIVDTKDYENKYKMFDNITYIETKHVDALKCYGIRFDTKDGIVYYSGDSENLNNILKFINDNEKIDKIYEDITTNKKSHHVFIDDLLNKIPKEYYSKIYCMHINNKECMQKALENGMNVAKII